MCGSVFTLLTVAVILFGVIRLFLRSGAQRLFLQPVALPSFRKAVVVLLMSFSGIRAASLAASHFHVRVRLRGLAERSSTICRRGLAPCKLCC